MASGVVREGGEEGGEIHNSGSDTIAHGRRRDVGGERGAHKEPTTEKIPYKYPPPTKNTPSPP
jgi:hypothetical protein